MMNKFILQCLLVGLYAVSLKESIYSMLAEAFLKRGSQEGIKITFEEWAQSYLQIDSVGKIPATAISACRRGYIANKHALSEEDRIELLNTIPFEEIQIRELVAKNGFLKELERISSDIRQSEEEAQSQPEKKPAIPSVEKIEEKEKPCPAEKKGETQSQPEKKKKQGKSAFAPLEELEKTQEQAKEEIKIEDDLHMQEQIPEGEIKMQTIDEIIQEAIENCDEKLMKEASAKRQRETVNINPNGTEV